MDNKPRLELWALCVCLMVCLAAGVVGSIFTSPAVGDWYAQLHKPIFNPPDWIFAPVWTALYIMMAVAVWIIWRRRTSRLIIVAMWLFGFQLALNAAWSIIFFGLHQPLMALIDLAMLWAVLIATLVVFWRISRTAGILLLPYLAWVSFAGVLNAAIVALNIVV